MGDLRASPGLCTHAHRRARRVRLRPPGTSGAGVELPLSKVAEGTNDLFLERPEAGAQDYGRMVDLFVAWRGPGSD